MSSALKLSRNIVDVPRRLSRHARQTKLRRMRASLMLPVAVSAAHAMEHSTSIGSAGSVAADHMLMPRSACLTTAAC